MKSGKRVPQAFQSFAGHTVFTSLFSKEEWQVEHRLLEGSNAKSCLPFSTNHGGFTEKMWKKEFFPTGLNAPVLCVAQLLRYVPH